MAAAGRWRRHSTSRRVSTPRSSTTAGWSPTTQTWPPSPRRCWASSAALERLGKEAAIHVYEGAEHAFANPSGTRYQAQAAEDAWAKTVAFFAEHLG
ncbi:MAG: dienelactone hydrolase family protein [Thermoanaerobaculia bacterium]